MQLVEPTTDAASRNGSEIQGAIDTVTGETFENFVLQVEGPTVVEFMTYGCAHCRVMEPVLQEVASIVKPDVKMFRVNTAVDQELADEYAVEGTPTLIMFLNGTEVGRAEGPSPTVSSVQMAVMKPFNL